MPTSESLSKEIEAAVEQAAVETEKQAAIEQGTEEQEAEEQEATETTAEQTGTEEVADVAEETEETEEVDDGVTLSRDEDREETERPEITSSKAGDDGDTDESSVPELSDEIITRAIKAGLSLSDAVSFPSEAALERVVATAERAAKPAVQKDTVAEETPDPFAELKLDPEKYEPEVVEMFEKVTGVLKSQHEQIQGFKQAQEALEQAQNEAAKADQLVAAQEIEAWFDTAIKGLGKDFIDALGEGDYSSLDLGSSQFANRGKIAEKMSVLLGGYIAQDLAVPSREDIFKDAVEIVLRDEIQKIHEKKLAGDLKKQAGQHIQRAGGSKGTAAKTPEQEVAQALQKKFGI
jgi:hypothetical protein